MVRIVIGSGVGGLACSITKIYIYIIKKTTFILFNGKTVYIKIKYLYYHTNISLTFKRYFCNLQSFSSDTTGVEDIGTLGFFDGSWSGRGCYRFRWRCWIFKQGFQKWWFFLSVFCVLRGRRFLKNGGHWCWFRFDFQLLGYRIPQLFKVSRCCKVTI